MFEFQLRVGPFFVAKFCLLLSFASSSILFFFLSLSSHLFVAVSKTEDPVVARAIQRANEEFAKTKKPSKSAWGSFLSFVAAKEEEAPVEMLFDMLVAELTALSKEALIAVAAPARSDRRRVFASALAVAAMKLIPTSGLSDADEIFERCNAVYASVSVNKDPQVLVEHARVMIDWMTWRLDHEHLYDTALFYVVDAEYQLHEAK